jgi:hypothetical protein
VHNIRIIFTNENVSGSPHVGGELIDLIEAAIYDFATESGVTQISEYEVVRFRFGKIWEFKIDPTNPKAIPLQSTDKMAADKPTSATYQSRLHSIPLAPALRSNVPKQSRPSNGTNLHAAI